MNVFGVPEDPEKRALQSETLLKIIILREAEILKKAGGWVNFR